VPHRQNARTFLNFRRRVCSPWWSRLRCGLLELIATMKTDGRRCNNTCSLTNRNQLSHLDERVGKKIINHPHIHGNGSVMNQSLAVIARLKLRPSDLCVVPYRLKRHSPIATPGRSKNNGSTVNRGVSPLSGTLLLSGGSVLKVPSLLASPI